MKKILLSSAILALGTVGFGGIANAQSVETFDTDYVSDAFLKLQITQNSTGMHAGDFQSIAKAATASPLYTGSGAAAMASIRAFKY